MLRQDLPELRQRFLGAIFLVAGNQDNVLALAGAFRPLVDDPRFHRFFLPSEARTMQEDQDRDEQDTGAAEWIHGAASFGVRRECPANSRLTPAVHRERVWKCL